MTTYTKTLNVWGLIASARIYQGTPLHFYHRIISTLRKIDRREAKGLLVYTSDTPSPRFTDLPQEIRARYVCILISDNTGRSCLSIVRSESKIS